MALSFLGKRIQEGIGTIIDFAKAAQTDVKTRELQRELERRREQSKVPLTTGSIVEDISREVRRAQEGIRQVQLPEPTPERFVAPEQARESAGAALQVSPGFDLSEFVPTTKEEDRIRKARIVETPDIEEQPIDEFSKIGFVENIVPKSVAITKEEVERLHGAGFSVIRQAEKKNILQRISSSISKFLGVDDVSKVVNRYEALRETGVDDITATRIATKSGAGGIAGRTEVIEDIKKLTTEQQSALSKIATEEVALQIPFLGGGIKKRIVKGIVEKVIPKKVTPELSAISRLGRADVNLLNVRERAQELATYVDEKGITRVDGVKRVNLEKQFLKEANQEFKLAQNEFYESLNPKHKIGDVIEYQPRLSPEEIKVFGKKKLPVQKVKITGAEFDLQKSLDTTQRTGFPASFKFNNLVGKNIKTGEEVRLYKNNLVNGELLGDTIKINPETVLKEFIARQKLPKIQEPLTPPKPPIPPKGIYVPRERGFITSTKEILPEAKVAGQYIPRSTDRLAIKAKNLIKDDIVTAERLATTGTDDAAVATASELIKHYGELAKKASGAEKIAFYDKAATIANEIAPKLTEQGRAIQAASIMGRMTPEGQLRFAARVIQEFNEKVVASRGGLGGLRKKVPELTGKQAEDILAKAKKIQEMPDGVEKAMAFKKLQDEISDLVPSPWWKKIINVWKAGLLTGLKTSGLNEFSNLFHGVSEIVKDIPATAVDKVSSLFTGKRTLAFDVGGAKGISEGFNKGVRYMKTGFDERNVAEKLDWKRVNFGKSKFAKGVQAYEQLIFRWMGAMDQPFYYGAKARSIGSQAIAQGKNAKLKGKELQKFVQNLMENPTDDMIKYATNDAEISVFQNRTVLHEKVGGKIQEIPILGQIIVPFSRTPSSVAMQIINYSPVGIVKTIVTNIGKGRFDQRAFSQGIGRGITGTGVMFIGMELFKKDMIALDYPTTERERTQWELEGKKPNSIKVFGKWRSVLPLGPAGMTLILGGHLKKAVDENGSLAQALPEASFSALKSFQEQTFLVGVNNFANALNNPERYGQSVLSRTVGSIIPTIVSDVARATDPMERRTYSIAEGFTAPLKGRVPGIRKELEPKIDVLGNPVMRMGNVLETMLDPTRPSRIKSSDVIEELRRLFDAGFFATPTRFADEKKYTNVLTLAQITELQERAGTILEGKLTNLISDPKYSKVDDDTKMRTIKNFTNQARVIARAATIENIVVDLSEEQLRSKLSEFKASGFMTKQVFDKWEELFR